MIDTESELDNFFKAILKLLIIGLICFPLAVWKIVDIAIFILDGLSK